MTLRGRSSSPGAGNSRDKLACGGETCYRTLRPADPARRLDNLALDELICAVACARLSARGTPRGTQSPDRVEELDSVVKRLQNGDLKLRVRALEAERQLAKMAVMQAAQGQGMLAAAAANIGTVLFCAQVLPSACPPPRLRS